MEENDSHGLIQGALLVAWAFVCRTDLKPKSHALTTIMPPAPSMSDQVEAAAESQRRQATSNCHGSSELQRELLGRQKDSTASHRQASHATTSPATSPGGGNDEHLSTNAEPQSSQPPQEGRSAAADGESSMKKDEVSRPQHQDGMSPQARSGNGDILSRMVTASGAGSLRVASMQDFRRSITRGASPDGGCGGEMVGAGSANCSTAELNHPNFLRTSSNNSGGRRLTQSSLNVGGDTGQPADPTSFAGFTPSGGAAGGPGGGGPVRQSSHSNPLLRMMEERMAAKQAQQNQARAAGERARVPQQPRIAGEHRQVGRNGLDERRRERQ